MGVPSPLLLPKISKSLFTRSDFIEILYNVFLFEFQLKIMTKLNSLEIGHLLSEILKSLLILKKII